MYSREEVAVIIQAARKMGGRSGTLRPHRLATLVGLLYSTGLCVGEALSLDIGDIDPAAGRLTVRRGKLGKARNAALRETEDANIPNYFSQRH